MSTLPQTTPVMVPRPAAPAALITPTSAAAGQGNQLTAADAMRVVRTNKWLITALLIGSAIFGVALNYFLARYYSRYTATGLVQVLPYTNLNPLVPATPVNDTTLDRDQRTQVQIIKQEALLSKVLQNANSPIRSTSWFQQYVTASGTADIPEAKKKLMENFSVTAVPESRLISISMSYSSPKDCMTIVNEIVDQALKDQAQNNQNKQYEKSVMLTTLKVSYESKKRMLEQDLREKSVKLSSDGTMGGNGRLSAKEVELSNLVSERIVEESRLVSAQASAAAMDATIKAGQTPPRVIDAVDHDAEIMQLKQSISGVEMSIAEVGAKEGTAHSNYKALVERKKALDSKLEELKNDVRLKITAESTEQLKNQISESQTSIDRITKQIEAAKGEMAELTNNMTQYETIRENIARLDEDLRKVNTQLDDINSNNLNGGDISWVQHPITPDTPSFPIMKATVTISMILGLGLALGIAFLREIMDQTVRSPRDITRVGQMNLLGMVPDEQDDPQAAGARLPMVIFEAPHSITAENLRSIRTRLQHAASLDTTRSIMITSPNPGDGKTTIAVNLAAGLALIGRKILLVDANFRRPELHRLFGVDNGQGFATVLGAPDTFHAAIKETSIPNLTVLTTGPKPSNTTEMLESQLLPDFIAQALKEYDHVIFDGSPMLFSSEAVAMAPKVDGVVTVVRARVNTRGVLQRVRDSLRQTKAEHLGVVLNGVQAYGGGYYRRNIQTYYEYSNSDAA